MNKNGTITDADSERWAETLIQKKLSSAERLAEIIQCAGERG